MKTSFLLCFLMSGLAAMADTNLLQNGDFSAGLAEWEGDVHTAGSSSDTSGATTGVVVRLDSTQWTKVTQDFDGKAGDYVLTITYTVTPGLTFSSEAEDYKNVPGKLEFSRLSPFDGTEGRWEVIVNDLGAMHYRYWPITPNLTDSGVQTVKTHVPLDSDDTDKKGFYLIFPPGHGSINIQSISLVPSSSATP